MKEPINKYQISPYQTINYDLEDNENKPENV